MRAIWGLVFGLMVTSVIAEQAFGDIPPPPPPKGAKYVSVDHEVLIAADLKGFTYIESIFGFGRNFEPRVLELNDKKAVKLTSGDRRTSVSIFLVSDDEKKKLKSTEELLKKIANGDYGSKLPQVYFDQTAIVEDSIKGERVTWSTTITGVSKDNRPTVTVKGPGSDKKIKPTEDGRGFRPEPTSNEQQPLLSENTTVVGQLPQPAEPGLNSKLWLVGLAACLSLVTAGLWLFRRQPAIV